jgi:hypothetical protein
MADSKITGLPASAGLVDADLVEVVDDVAGTAASQKATIAQVAAATVGKSGVLIGASGVCKEDTLGGLIVVNGRGVITHGNEVAYQSTVLGSSSWSINWVSASTWFTGSPDTGLARSAAGVVKVTNGSSGSGKLLVGGATFLGETSSATTPTTTEFPNDGDWGFHSDTVTGFHYLAINRSGTVVGVQLLGF